MNITLTHAEETVLKDALKEYAIFLRTNMETGVVTRKDVFSKTASQYRVEIFTIASHLAERVDYFTRTGAQ